MTHITLAHGNGGRYMRELIEELFARHLNDPQLDVQTDAARIDVPSGELLITTDGFTVKPLEFPGGNIGSLAVHGTVNDLSVAGATPLYLTLNAFIEEGLEIETLERLVVSLADAAREAGVRVVAGDTKVVPRGEGSGLYLATTGVGVRPGGLQLGLDRIEAGDLLLVSGPVGDHGTAVMLAREQFGLRGDLCSDAASVTPLTEALRDLPGVRFMRDPTRGGIATPANSACACMRWISPFVTRYARCAKCSATTLTISLAKAGSSPSSPQIRLRRRCRHGRPNHPGRRPPSSAPSKTATNAWSCRPIWAGSVSWKNWRTIPCPASADKSPHSKLATGFTLNHLRTQ